MEPTFFFTQPANVCDDTEHSCEPCVFFEGEPIWFKTEYGASMSARRQYAKGDYDVVIVFGGDWHGRCVLVSVVSKYSDGQRERPRGYYGALSSTVKDAEFVLRRMLGEYISLRS